MDLYDRAAYIVCMVQFLVQKWL